MVLRIENDKLSAEEGRYDINAQGLKEGGIKMKKALAILAVAAMTLTAFAGTAQGTVFGQYWDKMNSQGWINQGPVPGPNYQFFVRYQYQDHMVWKEYDGTVYIPSAENLHIGWMIKIVDSTGKPALFSQYHCNLHLWFGPPGAPGVKGRDNGPLDEDPYPDEFGFAKTRIHLVDPMAVEDENSEFWGVSGGSFWIISMYAYFTGQPMFDVINDDRRPTEDTVPLVDALFENIDIAELPLIRQIETWTPDGYFNIQVALLD